MALDGFHVDWDPNVMQGLFTNSRERDAVPDSPIKHLFTWRESRPGERTRPVGERFKHLFFSTLDLPDEGEWCFERPLGKGSFGAAAVFSKINERQERIDAFVLKVTDANPEHFVTAQAKKLNLTQEAAVMAQANDLRSDSFVRLRQYKVDQQYCRFYVEFCEFGTLETLRLRYKAWNKHFPEPFLWHVFHCLARAYLDFVVGPWRSLEFHDFGQKIPGEYLLHNDIKTDNIFLGTNTSRDEETIWYPIPKIGDFGLSMTTNADELYLNTAQNIQRGSPCWHPPEHRIKYMMDFRKYHFGQDIHAELKQRVGLDRKFHRIRPEANIWAIGAVMWSLMTLGEMEDLSAKVNEILAGQGSAWRTFDGTNLLQRPDREVRKRYSPELWTLIQECTRLRPDFRPPPSRLLEQIQTNMQKCIKREEEMFVKTNDQTAFMVAFEQNQINDLPDGGADFKKPMQFWHDFADHLLWTPGEWGTMCPPEAPRFMNFHSDDLPSPLRRRQEERWEEAIRERDRKWAAHEASELQPVNQAQTRSRPSGIQQLSTTSSIISSETDSNCTRRKPGRHH